MYKKIKYKELQTNNCGAVPLATNQQTLDSSMNRLLYWRLFKQLGAEKKLWYAYVFIAFFSAFTTQLAVFTNQLLIDHVLPTYTSKRLFLFILGLSVYKLFDIFTSIFKRFTSLHLKNLLDRFFLLNFDAKMNSFSLRYIQSFKKGDLVERVSDAMKLKKFFTKFFVTIGIDIFIALYSLFILIIINWKASLSIIFTFMVFYRWFHFITPVLKENERIRFRKKAILLSGILEKIEAMHVIKSFGIEYRQTEKITNKIDEYLHIQLKNGYVNLINTAFVSLIIGIMSIVIIILLSHQAVDSKSISLGLLVTFLALSTKIFGVFKSILNDNLTIQENLIILKRFFDFQDDQTLVKKTQLIQDFKIQTLTLSNVNYTYTSKAVLQGVDFEIKDNQKIKIEGANGTGKSTFAKICTALYQPSSGAVFINDIHTQYYHQHLLHHKIILATNEDPLFNDTILENICLGAKIPMEQIIALSKKIGCYDFIAAKQEGFEYLISRNGKNISTGQRKKIILLRMLLSQAEIIILDEVLSGLDHESRIQIEKYIQNDSRKYIIISHEPVTYINFSKKYTLSDGFLTLIP